MNTHKLILLGTGGTIAGTAGRADDAHSYVPGVISASHLLAGVPQSERLGAIETESLFQIGSEDITPAHWLTLAQRAQYWLNCDDVAGVVITHGTDTLEETTYFLHLVLQTGKPVVMTGAMLPATAPDADGPANLFQALTLARSAEARGQGVLVLMHGQIFSARDVTKRHNRFDAFTAGDGQVLGTVDAAGAIALNAQPGHTAPFELPAALPAVEIVYGYATSSRVAVDAFVAAGVRGIVYAAPGSGTLSESMRQALQDAVTQGVVVVRASRVGAGKVRPHTHVPDDARLFVSANTLNPQKARVLLMLALTTGQPSVEQMQQWFDSF